MTRTSYAALGVLIALAAAGCAGKSATSPDATPAASLTGALPPTVALFDLTLDEESLDARITPIHTATAQPPQNLSYDLDIARYITPQTLSAVAVRKNDFGDIVVRFRHQHPFAAPDFAAPISGKNRADLSYTGRLMILADDTQQSLNAGSITVDPWVVREVDGYAEVGDLVRDTVGLTNTHFPYMLLADEAKNNREGVSNGAQAAGNYDAASGGWQRANAGANGKSWTGYDYIHAGQAIQNEFTVRAESFTGSSWTVQLAVVIQYTDPRGMGGLTLRFPPETVDVAQFAYRMPHSALDVSRVTGNWDLYMHPDAAAITKLNFSVRDWDGQASPSSDGDLSDEPDVAKVQPSGGGQPTVQLVMPDLVAGPLPLTVAGGNGRAGNEFHFTGDLTNAAGAAPGIYWGCLQVTDPSFADPDRSDYHFGVDPISYTPDATRALEAMTIIPVRIDVAEASTSWGRSWGDRFTEDATRIAVDVDGNTYVTGNILGKATDQEPGDSRLAPAYTGKYGCSLTRYDQYGNRLWTGFIGTPAGNSTFYGLFCTPDGDVVATLNTNETDLDVDPGPGTSLVGDGGAFQTAIVCYSPAGALNWSAFTPADPVDGRAGYPHVNEVVVGADGAVYCAGRFIGTHDFEPGPGETKVTSTGADAWLSRLDSDGDFAWVRTWGTTNAALGSDMYAVAASPNGNVVFGGFITLPITEDGGMIDLDPTAGVDLYPGCIIGSATFGVLTPAGDYVWGRAIGESSPGDPRLIAATLTLAADAQNRVYASCRYSGEGDIDPGPGTLLFDSQGELRPMLISFSNTGAFRWAFDYNPTDNSQTMYPGRMFVGDNGHLYFSADLFGAIDFDPGPGVELRTPPDFYSQILVSYNQAGGFRFANLLPNPDNLQNYLGLAPIPGGGIAGCGRTQAGDDIDWGPSTHAMPSHGGQDGFFVHLSEDGEWE